MTDAPKRRVRRLTLEESEYLDKMPQRLLDLLHDVGMDEARDDYLKFGEAIRRIALKLGLPLPTGLPEPDDLGGL